MPAKNTPINQNFTNTAPKRAFRKKVVSSGGDVTPNRLKDAPNLFSGGKDILISETFLPKDTDVPLHWHDYFEYEIILNGKAEHIYNEKKYSMERGWIYLSSYYDFHAIRATEDVRLLNIRFTENLVCDSLLNYLTQRPNRLICQINEADTLLTVKKIEKLDLEMSENKIFGDILGKGILSELIISLIRLTDGDVSGAIPRLVQQATAYINTSFRENIKLENTAKELSVTANYLGSVFKKELGTSFNEYLNNVRLKYSCNLLQSSDLTVKEVAYSSGYNSVEYFLYIFKKKFNITPMQYRKIHKRLK